jgi:hypothetical protein
MRAAAVHEALVKANFEADAAKLSDESAARVGLKIHARIYPILDVTVRHSRPLRLKLHCDSWDELPPSIELLNPDGSFVTDVPHGGIFHPGPHPNTGRPFVCMRGTREYHTHSSHLNDHWDNYRGQDGMNLPGIIMQIARVWRRLAK